MSADVAAELDGIADLVSRLGILHGDPERFHLDKDEAAKRLRRLAREMRGGSPRRSTLAERRAAMDAVVAPARRR